MEKIVKAYLQMADSTVEVRRISLPSAKYETMMAKIASAFPDLKDKQFTLMWKDADDDFVIMSSDEELQDALANNTESTLKVYINVDGDMPEADGTKMDTENDPGQAKPEEQRANHEKEDPLQNGCPLFDGPTPPLPPAPPSVFGFGPWKKFMRRGHGHCPPWAPFAFKHHRGMPGFHGPMGRFPPGGPVGGHHGPFGHHGHFEGHHGHFGGHHGHFGGHHGHFGGHHGHFGAGQGPFWGPMGRHHGHGGPGGRGRHGHHKWIAELREKVPEPHRHWAKRYIGLWRLQHLKNATTTSDSDNFDPEEKQTRESAGVPEAYVVWLDMTLPKWHRRWGKNDIEGSDTEDKSKKDNKDLKKELKASVPKEFRKWSKCYLAKHYGEREAPQLRDVATDQGANCAGRNWTKSYKMHSLVSQVNAKQRRWAKQFILKWRIENNLGELLSDTSSASESSDTETKSLTAEEAGVHEDYGHWLNKFLPRWHMWRGLMEKGGKPLEKGGMGKFKETVPMTFRRWVKFYLSNRYLKKAERAEKSQSKEQYRKWIKAFQKQWLLARANEDSDDVLILTSDDEFVKDGFGAATGEAENSFKRLRLDDNDKEISERQKKVNHEVLLTYESDDNDDVTVVPGRRSQHKAPVKPDFRRYAVQELSEWDGENIPGNGDEGASGDAELETISPHMYAWMTKMMMKNEKKRMKQEFKHAKKQMKASLKAQKRGF